MAVCRLACDVGRAVRLKWVVLASLILPLAWGKETSPEGEIHCFLEHTSRRCVLSAALLGSNRTYLRVLQLTCLRSGVFRHLGDFEGLSYNRHAVRDHHRLQQERRTLRRAPGHEHTGSMQPLRIQIRAFGR